MARRTSLHGLNGDRRLSAAGKAAYFLLNRINNARPYAQLDPRLAIRDFVCADLAARRPALPRGASPSRTLSDLFWLTLPWTTIRDRLGDVRVLDIGCGSGAYGPQLLAWAGGAIAGYTGTDVHHHEAWRSLEASDRRLHFHASRAERLGSAIPAATNLFISQSALEHIDEDLEVFRQIRDYARAANGPVLQVHLIPSQACLALYLLHGVRQYTPRTVSAITRLFDAADQATLYRLGGSSCVHLHHAFITRPWLFGGRDRRAEDPDAYDRMLFEAIADDMARPQPSPAFYALFIQSGLSRSIV